MDLLKGKKIVVGVTGSIAAYKSALLVRELRKNGSEVFVIMTGSATKFITPLTLANLSQNPVSVDMFDINSQTGGAWHIHRAHECDLMIIAPCSATTIGKIANGICDNSLVAVATALPKDIPLLIAPAMDSTMYESKANQRNLRTLQDDGIIIIPPDDGELSSGITGPGRLPENDVLIDSIVRVIGAKKKVLTIDVNTPLKGKRVLISSGPTREKIDDVRYISNYSSGKMGVSLAQSAKNAGADVVLVSGPVNIAMPDVMKIINVESAAEMHKAITNEFEQADICIMAAAVSDFAPANKHNGKIKKEDTGDKLAIELKKNPDILYELGQRKKSNQMLIGFALESSNEIENGMKKLKNKNCDLIVVNSAGKVDSGFEGDKNTITILNKNGEVSKYPALSKKECADIILSQVSFITATV